MAGEAKRARVARARCCRARSVLSQPLRHGLRELRGADLARRRRSAPLRERFRTEQGDHEVEEEKRRFVQRLGFRLLREVNDVAVSGATSVSATGAPRRAAAGLPRSRSSSWRAHALTELLRVQRVHLTDVAHRGTRRRTSARASRGSRRTGSIAAPRRQRRHRAARPAREAPEPGLLQEQHDPLLPRAGAADARAPRGRAGERAPRRRRSGGSTSTAGSSRCRSARPSRGDIERWLAYYRETGAVTGDRPDPKHPVMQVTCGVLESFREAYLVGARTLTAEKAVADRAERPRQANAAAVRNESAAPGRARSPRAAPSSRSRTRSPAMRRARARDDRPARGIRAKASSSAVRPSTDCRI